MDGPLSQGHPLSVLASQQEGLKDPRQQIGQQKCSLSCALCSLAYLEEGNSAVCTCLLTSSRSLSAIHKAHPLFSDSGFYMSHRCADAEARSPIWDVWTFWMTPCFSTYSVCVVCPTAWLWVQTEIWNQHCYELCPISGICRGKEVDISFSGRIKMKEHLSWTQKWITSPGEAGDSSGISSSSFKEDCS